MNPTYRYDIEQNTDEWFAVKVAKFSASSASDLLMDKTTKGYSGLISRIAEERITGERCENNQFKGNWATERGHELEPIARNDYEFRTLTKVDIVGVVELNEWTLCSPDGLIGSDKLHQIKCPIFSTQKKYLEIVNSMKSKYTDNEIMRKIDFGYYKQMQFELYCCDRDVNVFTSFHPNLRSIDLNIVRDKSIIEDIIKRLDEATSEVKEEVKRIINL